MSTLENGDIASAAQYIMTLTFGSELRLSAILARRFMVASTVSRVVSRTEAFVINHERQKQHTAKKKADDERTFTFEHRGQWLEHGVEWA